MTMPYFLVSVFHNKNTALHYEMLWSGVMNPI